ncbi:MAG: GNAT family N-acetyltransferase [Clostridia bacterium]|nr:GNAT family N-acetyltransferase [Clostridia bacterium]
MIQAAGKSDSTVLAELAWHMWHDHTLASLRDDFEKRTEDQDSVCFIKYADKKPVGFAQCQLRRDYVEGTETSPVGYLEGIFILEEYRHLGYAKELLLSCENWAKEKHCSEFASDCELENDGSRRFHIAMGFTEANRIICFTKRL